MEYEPLVYVEVSATERPTLSLQLRRTRTMYSMSTARILIAIGCFIACPVVCGAQALSPYSAFQSMSLSELQTSQLKLTYLGVQNAPVASVGLSVAAFNLNVFVPFRRSGIGYTNEN